MQISDGVHQIFICKIEELLGEFKSAGDVFSLEKGLREACMDFLTPLLERAVNELLADPQRLSRLKQIAGAKGMGFRGYRELEVRVLDNRKIGVWSPYFYKRPRKKRGPKRRKRARGNNPHCHPGLSAMGFIGRCSPHLASEVVKMAVLSPSFKTCSELLADRGIDMGIKTVRSICRKIGLQGLEHRGRISLSGEEDLRGHTLVVGTDGGRLRERRPKPGRKLRGQKRQGYYSDWCEPKMITMYLQNAQGEDVQSFAPIHDATMERADATFDLVRTYFEALPLDQLQRIVFVGDGAPWIWDRVERLIEDLQLDIRCFQVIDFTHAKQALYKIWEWLPARLDDKARGRIWQEWENALWEGRIEELGELISRQFKTRNRGKAQTKWRNYFWSNQKRMQYTSFDERNIPCGSGCVESAIRRVINQRLKAPGTFWTKQMAECFLFLRSQLISGRWKIFMENLRNIRFNEAETQRHSYFKSVA